MKKSAPNRENRSQLRKKLTSAGIMLLIASLLMTTTSFAWLVMSTAPEVSGITTNIGANGSLEIALLTTETREDLSAIRTTIGTTLSQRDRTANNSWGNLVDLSYTEYGLGSILLLPSRLNLIASGDSYHVDTGMLSVPTYSFDGRIEKLTDDTISAVYGDRGFSFVMGTQDYGVRAIGTTNALSVQGSALAMAKSNIATYTNSALNGTTSIMNDRGDTLFSIVLTHSVNSDATYGDSELNALKEMLKDMQGILNYIDLALRQGAVAFAASRISNPDTFTTVKDQIMDTSKELSAILSNLPDAGSFSGEYLGWLTDLNNVQNDLNAANYECTQLTGGTYTWQQFRAILDYLMNMDHLYINDKPFADFDSSSAGELMGGSINLVLAPGSGIFADIANFVGNFKALLTYVGTDITISTTSTANPAHLSALSASVKDLEPAESEGSGGAGEEQTFVDLTATYGYALDLAFRCNAPASDLLLQTSAVQRVYGESDSGNTMGGGSYMEFSAMDSGFPLSQRVQLMDAVRVAFLDDQNKVLCIAKLNTSNYVTENGVMKAPLYIYDYSISEEDGSMIMGERRNTDNVIAPLPQNAATAITVVVWLDGDIVDNTMVSATEAASLSGVLNLQFASSADLVPAAERDLLSITANLSDLQALVEEKKPTVEAGQGTYTTVSWEAFILAYNYAESVSNNASSNEIQVYHASVNLKNAFDALEVVSQDTIKAQIQEMRDWMGNNGQLERYVIADTDGGYITAGNDPHTQEEHDSWDIKGTLNGVDYNNNLHDEGNDIFTPIYTDESWLALADALYRAEAVVMNTEATDSQLDTALTNLNSAYEGLERMVFYKPYEYNGSLYYEAICDAENADTYGKWYDSDFKRVVADITILNLDAYAQTTDVAYISQDLTVSNTIDWINPTLLFYDGVYPSLSNEEFQGVNWSITNLDPVETEPEEDAPSPDIIGSEVMTWKQYHRIEYLLGLVDFYGLDEEPYNALLDISYAEELLISDSWTDSTGKVHNTYSLRHDVTAAQADAAIEKLEADMAGFLSLNYLHGSDILKLEAAVEQAKAVVAFYEAQTPTEPDAAEPAPDLTELRSHIGDAEYLLEDVVFTAQEICDLLREINQIYTYDVDLRNEYESLDLLATEIDTVAKQDDYGYPTFSQLLLLRATLNNFEKVAKAEDAPSSYMETYYAAMIVLNDHLLPITGEAIHQVFYVLNNLNDELAKLGENTVTDSNTVPDHIHGGGDIFEIGYPTKYPDLPLSLTGKTGNVRLTAQVLTKNGIVFSVSEDLYVYTKPYGGLYGVDINGAKLDINYDLTLNVGETAVLRADLRTFNNCAAEDFPTDVDLQKQVALGNLIYKNVSIYGMPYVRYEPVHPAHPDTYSWASSNTDMATITGMDAYSCTVEAKAPGTATISVVVVTEEGDYVTESITVFVKK